MTSSIPENTGPTPLSDFQHTVGWSQFPWLFTPDTLPQISAFYAGFSDYFVNTVLGMFNSVWMSLHYANPNLEGALTSEISGGGYIRQSSAFPDASNRTAWLSNAVKFTALPSVTLGFIGLWDSQFNGNIMAAAPMSQPLSIPVGGSYAIAANSLALFID